MDSRIPHRNSKALLSLVLFAMLALGCGGGGGGDGGATFAGTWSGTLFLVDNNCGFTVDDDQPFIHVVNQDNDRVVVDVIGGGSFPGEVQPDRRSFIVGAQTLPPGLVAPGLVCSSSAGVGYFEIQGDEADVVTLYTVDCADLSLQTLSCEVGYVGVATRSS